MKNVKTNKFKLGLVILFLHCWDFCHSSCNRKPPGASGDRSPVDENYQIQIDGNPAAYKPGQQYNISLSCANGLMFISFNLLLEADTTSSSSDSYSNVATAAAAGGVKADLGHFEIIDNAETKFNSLCENMIESSNTNAKNRVNVAWIAPSDQNSGCILFKAAILQHRNVWFIDDGFLTKRLCREDFDGMTIQQLKSKKCCACDEAKYELVIERMWKRNTHAKDFPSEPWRTRLGEVVGASHDSSYHFWTHGAHASKGLQELAEHGATKTLEYEIKKYTGNGSIRTIIKAPGIKYRPNVTGKTLATVRVGSSHNLISLVLKIEPSPDWILGVSDLNLCLANCTWLEKQVINLYPWDIGTDAGPSYMSPDQAQNPPDVIRPISSTFPSDYRSPFFDKAGAPIKPLATLHVNRKRTYERQCDFEEAVAAECSTHPWSNWSDCNVKCGAGMQYRFRFYKDPKVAANFKCNATLRQNQNCRGTECGMSHEGLPSAECELTNWSAWSECSKKCGKGLQTRTRNYSSPYAREKCQAGVSVDLQQTRSCNGENCGGNIFSSSYDADNNDFFEQNFDNKEANPNVFKNTQINRKFFGKGQQQQPSWRATDSQEQENNFEGLDNNRHVFDENTQLGPQAPNYFENNNENEETENVSNIYGNEKLVSGNSRHPFGQRRFENTNLFGDLESEFGKSKFRTNNRNYAGTSGFSNTPNTFSNSRDPNGFKTIESEELDQQKVNFCFIKPSAPTRPCNKKRPIVKNYWFFDADDGECKLFTADNCDVNSNKFLTMEKCLETCSQSIMQNNQDENSFNRGPYGTREFGETTPSAFRSRWH